MAIEILIVDDEKDIRDLVAGVLEDEGYECRTAGDARSAVTRGPATAGPCCALGPLRKVLPPALPPPSARRSLALAICCA